MTFLLLLGVMAAGGVGALLRWALERWSARAWSTTFPLGILVVNVSGSFALGICVAFFGVDTAWGQVLGTGLLGGYTTFSSVAATSAVMLRERRTRSALLNVVGTFVLSVIAALLGVAIGAALR